MKNLAISLLLLIAVMTAFAQNSKYPDSLHKMAITKHQLLLESILFKQIKSSSRLQKPTGIKQRVIAQSSYDGSRSTWDDSAIYKYSDARGSQFNPNSQYPYYSFNFTSDYSPNDYYVYTNRTNMDLFADSIYYYNFQILKDTFTAYYRSDSQMDSFMDFRKSHAPDPDWKRTQQKFNNSGHMTQYSEGYANYNNPFIISQQRSFFYDQSGTQLLFDTTFNVTSGNHIPITTNSYHYNSQYLLDSIIELDATNSYNFISIISMLYDTSGRIIELTQKGPDASGVGYYEMTSNINYTGNSPLYSELIYNVTETTDTSRMKTTRFFGANNLVDSISRLYADGPTAPFEYHSSYKYYYNSFDNPDSIFYYGSSPIPAIASHFYYETYDDSPVTAIAKVNSDYSLNFFPNPFDNELNIEWKLVYQNKVMLKITNLLGETVYSTPLIFSPGNNIVHLPILEKGNYILQIQDTKGDSWSRKLVRN